MRNYELAKLLEIIHHDSNLSDETKDTAYLELARRLFLEDDEEVKQAVNDYVFSMMTVALSSYLYEMRINYIPISEKSLKENLEKNKLMLDQLLNNSQHDGIKKLENLAKEHTNFNSKFDN